MTDISYLCIPHSAHSRPLINVRKKRACTYTWACKMFCKKQTKQKQRKDKTLGLIKTQSPST